MAKSVYRASLAMNG